MDTQQLEAFEVLEKIIMTVSHAELPNVVGALGKLQALATLRLMSTVTAPSPVADEGDKLLGVEAASKLLGLSPAQLARRRNLPFRRVLGRKTIRYSSAGIARWLARKRT